MGQPLSDTAPNQQPDAGLCQAKNQDGTWETLTWQEAVKQRRTILRCIACHGAGRIRGKYTFPTAVAVAFDHHIPHRGCPLKRDFSGTPSRHPTALD